MVAAFLRQSSVCSFEQQIWAKPAHHPHTLRGVGHSISGCNFVRADPVVIQRRPARDCPVEAQSPGPRGQTVSSLLRLQQDRRACLRIMSDVEGVRNIIGTGLVEVAGGLLTATIVLLLMWRMSPLMTGVAVGFLLIF